MLILVFGIISLAQGLPSLTENNPVPTITPINPNIVIPPLLEASSKAINTFSCTDPTCNFSFNFPDNWKEYEEVKETLKAELDFWEGEYLLASFFVYVKDTDLSLSQYAIEEEWMMIPQNMPDYKKISEEAINVGKLPAIQRLYTYTFIANNNTKIALKAIDTYSCFTDTDSNFTSMPYSHTSNTDGTNTYSGNTHYSDTSDTSSPNSSNCPSGNCGNEYIYRPPRSL